MPLRKIASYQGLKDKPTYIVRDGSPFSDEYFNIVSFPNKLTSGKNLFKIRANSANFVQDSRIYVEILDFNGNPIYNEPLDYIEKDGTRVIAVYIYPDTSPGVATVYLAGRIGQLTSRDRGQKIPFSRDYNSPNHTDIPNILWSRRVPVAPFESNDSEIIFTKAPSTTIKEVTQTYQQPVNINNVFTVVTANNASLVVNPKPVALPALPSTSLPKGGLSPNTPNFGKQFFDTSKLKTSLQNSAGSQMDSPPLRTINGYSKLTTTNFPLSKSMEGGILKIQNPIVAAPSSTGRNSFNQVIPKSQTGRDWNNNTSTTSTVNTPLSGSIEFAIVSVINDTTAEIGQISGFRNSTDNTFGPFKVEVGRGTVRTTTGPTGTVYSQVGTATINAIQASSNFTASFVLPSVTVNTQNSSSFADIILANTEPSTGDVYRIKTLFKPSGFFGDFTDLGDTILERQNILVDTGSLETNIAVGSSYEQYGKFENLSEINTYWTTSSIGTTNPVTITYNTNILVGGAQLITNWSGINQYTASVDAASVFQIRSKYRPFVYADTTYIVKCQVALPSTIGLYNSLDSNIPNNRLDVYVSGSVVESDSQKNINLGEIFTVPNFQSTLTRNFADGGALGTRIGTIQSKSSPGSTGVVTFQFKAKKTGRIDLKFVTRRGSWIVGEIEIEADKQTGFTPNYVRIFKRIPTEHLKTPLTFKFQYYDFRGNKADLETIAYGAIFNGGNVYIDGTNNLMTGSTYIGNSIGSGIEMAGVSSGYVRSVGYKGFTSASTGKGPGGFLMWSGSNNLTVGADTYLGVGLELIAGSGSYFRYRTNPSEIIVQTDKFFFGSQNQFISGANGNIEISSSNFHLQPDGDVVLSGTITANAGQIGGWSIGSTYLSSSNLILDSNGSLRTANYIPDFQGWAISSADNGSAEFQNVKIRGTLSTAVFEKQSVNAVGGQLYVANSTTLTASAQYPDGLYPSNATTMSVENVTGFVANEILTAKKISSTGFKTEYIRVISASRNNGSSDTDLSGRLFVQRAYGVGSSGPSASLGDSPSTAQSYSGSQVLVSTGRVGTGFIRINANPADDSTPFIDIVERTGSGIYAVDLKARLGDLSGLAGTSKVLGRSNPGFGLATDNVYLQGGINARFGNIGGFNITANAITGSAFFLSGSAPNSGVNLRRNMFISSSRFNVKGNGDITGSQVLFTGGRIGGFNISANSIRSATANAFFISGSANNSGANLKSNMFISASRFNVKGNGDVTASNALFNGTATAVNFQKRRVTVTNANSGSYLFTIPSGPLAGQKNLVFDGSLGGEICMVMEIATVGGFQIASIVVPSNAGADATVDVYINTAGMTFNETNILQGSPTAEI